MRLDSRTHGLVTKTLHKTLPRNVGGVGPWGPGAVGAQGSGVHSIWGIGGLGCGGLEV